MIRRAQTKDLERLKALHAATGFEWDFPDDAISAWVWVDENDDAVMMAGARVIAEAVLISSKQGTPQQRLAIMERLMEVVRRDVDNFGISEAVAWIPDGIWKAFSRRLKRLGWKAIRYHSMVMKVGE
jgi:hypothetical protein